MISSQRGILVIGGSSGIGAAIANRILQPGDKFVIVARNMMKLKKVASLLEAKGGEVSVFAADLCESDAIRDIFDFAVTTLKQIDVVVYSAGVVRLGEIGRQSVQDIDLQVRVNLTAPSHLFEEVVKHMSGTTGGYIIGVGSSVADQAIPGTSAYSASKVGFRRLIETLDAENRMTGIRAVVVEPGWVKTSLAANPSTLDIAEQAVLTADDVAESVAWVLQQPSHISIGPVLSITPRDPRASARESISRLLERRKS